MGSSRYNAGRSASRARSAALLRAGTALLGTDPLMDVLDTHIRPDSPEFAENRAAMTALVAELRGALERARQGGGAKSLQRHRDQGKLPVRERIDRLLDPGSPFLEVAALAAHGMYDDDAPGAGLVTGIGRVAGRELLIVA